MRYFQDCDIRTMVLLAPDYVDARLLAAGVAETHTVPSGAAYVLFSANTDFYVNTAGGTAAVPVADVTDGTASFLTPVAFKIEGLTSFSVISPNVCVLTMAFYK